MNVFRPRISKKIIIPILLLIVTNAFSQKNIVVGVQNNYERIIKNTENSLEFDINISDLRLFSIVAAEQEFTRVSIANYYYNNEIGFPELPVFSKLIEIPENSFPEISIVDYDEVAIQLNDYGFNNPLFPNQRSISKSQENLYAAIEKNAQIYTNKEFYSPISAGIKKIGTFRKTAIAQIVLNPFRYDIATNTLYLKNKISVKIAFLQKNTKSTTKKRSLISKEFLPVYKKLWNFEKNVKTVSLTSTPIKYLIISDRMFENELQNFISWKTMEGYNVSVAYTDIIGSSVSEIKSYIQNIYNLSSEGNPAPSYLLLVGDVEQIPAFFTHGYASDLYYCTFDGENDFIPDMFYGRLSAQNQEQLHNQIEKIIKYEQCNFLELDFLQNTTLIAGYDNTFGPVNANGQMNYISTYYFNQEHDINNSIFLCPDSQYHTNEIKTAMSVGNSFVNYTGHCVASRWSNPNISNNDVYSLTNENKFSFVLANCCLSAKYNTNEIETQECIAESFMRAAGKGAATYIGASDLTYWNEDYYWTVGFTNHIISNPSYESTENGVFDKLLHEKFEEPIKNAAQMVFAGNMIVTESNSENTVRYWEVYTILGDPSLMPFIGMPENIFANYTNSINNNATFLNIYTEENCYVAISINNSLIDAKYSDQNGFVHFDLENIQIGTINVVITKQFKIPHIGQIIVDNSVFENDIAISQAVNLQNIYYGNPVSIVPQIEIVNLGSSPIEEATLSYSINNQNAVNKNWTGNLNSSESMIVSFDEILLQSNFYNFEFAADINNDGNINNNYIQKTVKIFAGNVELSRIVSPETIVCGTDFITPEICVKNFANNIITSLKCKMQIGEINNEIVWSGLLQPNDSVYITFPAMYIFNGDYTISFEILETNGGLNENLHFEKTQGFSINSGDLIRIEILTDTYGNEVRWELLNLVSNEVVLFDNQFYSGLQIHRFYQNCFDSACFKFTIFDSFGDGMHYQSLMGFVIITQGNDTILNLKGDEYTNKFEKVFCINDELNSINSVEDAEVFVSPNPTNSFINVKTNNNRMFNIEIFNTVGEMVSYESNLSNNSKIDMSTLKDGIYFVKIVFGDKVSHKKIIVQK